MEEVKNLLTVTLVVMAAGSSIYTIKTYMKPGMDLNINLEESAHLQEETPLNVSDFLSSLSSTTETNLWTTDSSVINNTISSNGNNSKANNNKTFDNNSIDRRRSLSNKELKSSAVTVTNQTATKPESTTKPLVTTSVGKIEGIHQNVLGRSVSAFLGVPYAQAPIDRLRFKRPVPMSPWTTKHSAKHFGNACLQPDWHNHTRTTGHFAEDCLHLNIWTPTNSLDQITSLPVLFFIHGGSFIEGSNSADETDGRVLAALQNLVVVSANYRLGPFGFLKLDSEAQDNDNLGLHDLAEALRWTHNNIKHFGGDPDSITVMGHSSGALASALMLTSPETKGLIKRAILQSGSSTVLNFYYQQSKKSSEEFASLLGCLKATDRVTATNSESVWRCIQNANITELQRTAEKQMSRDSYTYSPRMGDSFVPRAPQILLDELNQGSEKKEILIGTNSNEAAFFVNMGYPQLFTKKSPSLKDLEEVRQFLSASLKDWGISRRTLRLINSFFLEKSSMVESKAVFRSMYDIFGDLTFTCPTIYFADKFATKPNHSSYFYFYSHGPNRSNVATNDELAYVFGYPMRFPQKYSGQDIDFSKQVMNTWATFIRTGKPALVNGSDWPQYSFHNQSYVELNAREFRAIHLANDTINSTATEASLNRFNCDTWKHAFKIFT